MTCSRCGRPNVSGRCRDCQREVEQGIRAGDEPSTLGVPAVESEEGDEE